MLASLLIILSNPILLGGLCLCMLLGGTSLFTAIHLCGIKGAVACGLKYALAIVSIEAITNFFMIVLNPQEFLYTYQGIHSINIVVGFIAFWIVVYEANWVVKHPRVHNFFRKPQVIK